MTQLIGMAHVIDRDPTCLRHLILHTCLLHWSRYKIKESSLKGFLLWQLTDILDTNVLEIRNQFLIVLCPMSYTDAAVLYCAQIVLAGTDLNEVSCCLENQPWGNFSGLARRRRRRMWHHRLCFLLPHIWKTNQTQSDLRTPLTATSGRSIEIF